MIKRIFAAVLLAVILSGAGSTSTFAEDPRQVNVTNLWAFGDSLTDTGNLFFLSGFTVPPSPLYFEGRFSDGPVWIEHFADRLGLTFDISMPFASNWAIAGAFTGIGGLADQPGLTTGVLSQIGGFLSTGGGFDPRDLVVVWAGANDYFFTSTTPEEAVTNLDLAVTLLAAAGAEHFLVPNLPDLGATPLAALEGRVSELRSKSDDHNFLLSTVMAERAEKEGIEIFIVDIGSAFTDVINLQRVYGLTNVEDSCVIQLPDGSREPTMLCPSEDGSLDSTGFLFWDLIHPTKAVHELIAAFAGSTFVSRNGLPPTIFDPERISTQIALGKLRATGATSAPRP